jgi:hypothetical protein
MAQRLPDPKFAPLNSTQRWDLYWHDTFLSPGLYFASLGAASGMHVAHDPEEWGQGTRGYSKRAGTLLAAFTIQTTVREAGDALLGYDPRYRRCECRGSGKRFAHAIAWSFLTRNNSGSTRLDVANLAGAYASGMIPILWYPDRYSPLKDGFRLGTQQVGFSVGVDVIREFNPELKKAFRNITGRAN